MTGDGRVGEEAGCVNSLWLKHKHSSSLALEDNWKYVSTPLKGGGTSYPW